MGGVETLIKCWLAGGNERDFKEADYVLRRCKKKIVSLRNIELINLSPFQIGHSFNKWPPTVVFLNIR